MVMVFQLLRCSELQHQETKLSEEQQLKKQELYFYVLSQVPLLKYYRLARHHFVGLCGLEPIVFGYY